MVSGAAVTGARKARAMLQGVPQDGARLGDRTPMSPRAFLSRLANAAGVPPKLILDAGQATAFEKSLRDAEAEARAAGLTSTPSFLIGPEPGQGERLNPSRLNPSRLDIGAFSAAIDPQLQR